MIRIIFFILTFPSEISEEKLFRKEVLVNPEIKIIILISLLVFLLNKVMFIKRSSYSEEKIDLLISFIGSIVILCFILRSPLKFLLIIEICIYPLSWLILKRSKDKDKIESLKFMVILNAVGSFPFIVFISLYDLSSISGYHYFQFHSLLVFFIMMILFFSKTPVYFFHRWLTKVHVSSSGNCSIILASIIIKLGTIGIYKFFHPFCQGIILNLALSVALFSGIYFRIFIIRFRDAKTLIAISSVLHIAIILPIILIKKTLSCLSRVIIIVSHGLVSYFLFYLITLKYESRESRRFLFLKSLESIRKNIALMSVIFIFLNLGVPPFINFYSETLILNSIKIISSLFCLGLFLGILFLRILFTIQITRNLIYTKVEFFQIKESLSSIELILFLFYSSWSLLILWLI